MKKIISLSIALLMFFGTVNLAFADDISERAYMPTNLYIIGGSDNLVISWRNAQSETLSKVRFFDITEGETEIKEFYFCNGKELEYQELPQTNYYPVNFKLKDLEPGAKKKYKILSSFMDHKDTEFIFETYVESTSNPAIMGWGREDYGGANGYTPILPYIYTKDSHSGKSSLRIISNNQGIGDVYIKLGYSVAFNNEKNYQVSFWGKGNYGGVSVFKANGGTWDYGTMSGYSTKTGVIGDWQEIKYTLSKPVGNAIILICEGHTDYFCIDDIEIYELDGDGNIVGDNLVPYGNFETSDEVPSEISNLKTDEDVFEQVTLNWDKLEDTQSRINIYLEDGEDKVMLQSLSGDTTSTTISSLPTDVQAKLLICRQNAAYIESEGVEITVTPKAYPVIYDEITASKNSTVFTELISDRTMTIKTNVKNNAMGDDFTAELICVLFKDGEIVEIKTSGTKTIEQTPSSEDSVPLQMKFKTPNLDDGNYVLDVHLWRSWDSMRVLTPCLTLSEPAEEE